MGYEFRFPGVAPDEEKKSKIPYLHIVLFLLTFLTTYSVNGVFYSISIMTILFSHELGHYLACRIYKVPATFPFFIPVPLPPFGTFGAVIKMKGFIPNRKALFDIGVAGPIMGLVFTIPAILIGLTLSKVVAGPLPEGTMSLGEPYLFKFLSYITLGSLPKSSDVMLHPIAYAGWAGLLVTAINLLPIGQLDGGHIIYALFNKASKIITYISLVALFSVTVFINWGWALFLVLVFVLARKHPPTLNDYEPLDTKRIVLGIIMILIFFLSFTPVPFIMPK